MQAMLRVTRRGDTQGRPCAFDCLDRRRNQQAQAPAYMQQSTAQLVSPADDTSRCVPARWPAAKGGSPQLVSLVQAHVEVPMHASSTAKDATSNTQTATSGLSLVQPHAHALQLPREDFSVVPGLGGVQHHEQQVRALTHRNDLVGRTSRGHTRAASVGGCWWTSQ